MSMMNQNRMLTIVWLYACYCCSSSSSAATSMMVQAFVVVAPPSTTRTTFPLLSVRWSSSQLSMTKDHPNTIRDDNESSDRMVSQGTNGNQSSSTASSAAATAAATAFVTTAVVFSSLVTMTMLVPTAPVVAVETTTATLPRMSLRPSTLNTVQAATTTTGAMTTTTTRTPSLSPVETAKLAVSRAVQVRTQVTSELRAAHRTADQVTTLYSTAQQQAQQTKQSYINANDRLASMKGVTGISSKNVKEQQNKVGTCFWFS
jgi:hypothetical protein